MTDFAKLQVSFPVKSISPTSSQFLELQLSSLQTLMDRAPVDPKTLVSEEWERWIVENKQRNIADDVLIQTMVENGIDRQRAAIAVQVNQPLSIEWQRWIMENKQLNVPEAVMVQAMEREGIDRTVAIQAIRRAMPNSSVAHTLTAHHSLAQNQMGDVYTQLLRKLESIFAVNCKLQELSPHHTTIERRSHLSKQEFLEQYYAKNKPVILTGMMEDWPAMAAWSPDYFKQHYGEVPVEVQFGRNSDPEYEINANRYKKTMTLSDYIDLVVHGGETNDYYLVANNGNLEREELKALLNDIVFPDFLDPALIKDRVFLWIGPAGTVTPLHHDPLNVMMAHIQGRKRWRLISPDYTPLLYNYIGVFSKVDLEHPDYEKYPLFKQVQMIETVLEPGEIIFVPVGWWHQVRGLEISFSLSVTNFAFPNTYTYHNPSLRDPV